jgi:hypothetical protein
MITYERASELLEYNPDTGDLRWMECRGPAKAGQIAGAIARRGLDRGRMPFARILKIDGKSYQAHRIAWLLYTKTHPTTLIDHINRDPLDNRICNLRLATHSQNAMNRVASKDCKSGLKGVHCNKWGRWIASAKRHGVRYYLGSFETPEEAYLAYCRKAKELHGEFLNI